MNRTTIIRSPKDRARPFTKISNKLINDDRLSDIEVGMMVRILTKSDDWIINKTHHQKISLLTRGTFITAWGNLIAYGYIEQTKVFHPRISYTYKIIENPVSESECSTYQFPLVEIPQMEDSAIITTNEINDPKTNLAGDFSVPNESEGKIPRLEMLDLESGPRGKIPTIECISNLDTYENK